MQRLLFHAPLLALIVSAAICNANESSERWYVLEMQGQRAGWTVEAQTIEDGRVVSTAESRLTVRRGTTEIALSMKSRFVETEDGKPIQMSASTDMGNSPSTDRWVFTEDAVVWTSSAGGRETTKSLPNPDGVWLPPAAASRYTAKRLAAGADEITVRSIDPLNGLEPVLTTRTNFAAATIEVLGRTVAALRCDVRSNLYPDSISTEYITETGELLQSELTLGAMKIRIVAADEQLAKMAADPPELMKSLFITPNRPIRDPYRKRSGTYVVRATSGKLPLLPSVGSQRVQPIDERSARVTRAGSIVDVPEEREDREQYLESSSMITCDDARVIELAAAALAGAPDSPAARAELSRRYVHRHIRTKDLSVGFASAAETARTREGDCTEHGVLLAAMLRADGIPSRVVSGLIYADRFAGGKNIFGYHMWTQALLEIEGEPRWIDLDATLPDHLPVTATHIALGVHSLEGDSRVNALVELAPLMGRLAIDIESVE